MKIRKATVKDAALIAKINTLAEDPIDKRMSIKEAWVKSHFRDAIKDKKLDVFICDNKGVIALRREFSGYNNCELYWLTIDKNYGGQGIGTKLVKFIEKYAKKLKFKALYLYTHQIHKPAIKFYGKLGFRKINEFPNYYSNGDKSILMGKLLK